MVKIIIENLGQKEVTTSAPGRNVLQLLHGHGIDWMHACGGKGRCTTCKMIMLEGSENLAPLTIAEMGYRKQGLLNANERLACQAKIEGPIRVAVPDDSKLPHMKYSG